MNTKYTVYILQSIKFENEYYTGHTSKTLKDRLWEHNQGMSKYTKAFIPWKIKTYMVFDNEKKAIELEHYLKTGSGKAFRNKRLI